MCGVNANPVQLSKRFGGGVHVKQGRSFILLSRDEAVQLIADMQELLADDCPRAETMSKIATH
ncbi:hypothetical protein K883_05124 [Mycobacterium sp. TKK-01-0059]|nr:hypothetical protein K883_05124 [Mycobacterium sp. TKK-01-0059]